MTINISVDELLEDYDRRIYLAREKLHNNKKHCMRCGSKFYPRHRDNRLCEKCSNFAKNEFLGDNFIA